MVEVMFYVGCSLSSSYDLSHGLCSPVARAALASLLGGLCTQPAYAACNASHPSGLAHSARSLAYAVCNASILAFDLPFEMPSPFGQLGLAEHLQPTFPIDQIAGNGAQLRLSLACCCRLSRWQGRFSPAGWCRSLLGELWWRSLGWRCVLLSVA